VPSNLLPKSVVLHKPQVVVEKRGCVATTKQKAEATKLLICCQS
jgi:hypothetical protein